VKHQYRPASVTAILMHQNFLFNQYLVPALIAWAIAQGSKALVALIMLRRIDLSYLVSSGGMPSSHSALVMGLATSIARLNGIHSASFAIAAVLAAIIMYDATGVRRAVSIQARILNRMIDEYFQGQNFTEKRLRELIGHTPVQVFVGALIGFLVGWFLS